jgi:hypothetical protein
VRQPRECAAVSRRRLLAGIPAAALLALLAYHTDVALIEAAALAPKASSLRLGQSPSVQAPTLLVYNSAQGLLSGDLAHAISPAMVQAEIDTFPSNWVTLGVGTTNQVMRTGELIPDGTARDIRFWWADPDSPSQADVSNLVQIPGLTSVELPFLAIGIADRATAVELTLSGVADIHARLKQELLGAGIELAAVRIEGTFGEVMTTVSYNIPPTGIPSGSVYSSSDFFRFGDYPDGEWDMDGVYAAPEALQPVISTAGNPLHLHGYQPTMELGGHIVSAEAEQVTARIYPLSQVVVRPTAATPSE